MNQRSTDIIFAKNKIVISSSVFDNKGSFTAVCDQPLFQVDLLPISQDKKDSITKAIEGPMSLLPLSDKKEEQEDSMDKIIKTTNKPLFCGLISLMLPLWINF